MSFRILTEYGIYNPLLNKEDLERYKKMEKEFKEATGGNVVKFEKEGDSIEGTFLGYEESKQYEKSYAVRIKDGEVNKVVFVSNIVIDLIRSNQIQIGQEIRIVYQGKKKTIDGKKEYNDYKLFFK